MKREKGKFLLEIGKLEKEVREIEKLLKEYEENERESTFTESCSQILTIVCC